MYKNYSRLHSLEEKRNIRKSIVFLFLTGVLIIGIIFVGLPLVAKFAIFLGNLKKSNTLIEVNDITPPAPPRFEPSSDTVNAQSITINGTSESGATVSLYFNNNQKDIIANNEGSFSLLLNLIKGDNIFYATAKDKSGNISQKTQEFKIIFDNEPPKLEISSPTEGSKFFGAKQKQISIQGTTEKEANITINDRFVKVDENGQFNFSATLSDGENTFNIKSVDKAGNLTEKNLKVSFTS